MKKRNIITIFVLLLVLAVIVIVLCLFKNKDHNTSNSDNEATSSSSNEFGLEITKEEAQKIIENYYKEDKVIINFMQEDSYSYMYKITDEGTGKDKAIININKHNKQIIEDTNISKVPELVP